MDERIILSNCYFTSCTFNCWTHSLSGTTANRFPLYIAMVLKKTYSIINYQLPTIIFQLFFIQIKSVFMYHADFSSFHAVCVLFGPCFHVTRFVVVISTVKLSSAHFLCIIVVTTYLSSIRCMLVGLYTRRSAFSLFFLKNKKNIIYVKRFSWFFLFKIFN